MVGRTLRSCNRYCLRRSANPALERAPPLSSIINQPAEVFGMDRSAEPVSVAVCWAAVAVEAVVAGAIVLRDVVALPVVLGCMVLG